jgi:hypothetical protein
MKIRPVGSELFHEEERTDGRPHLPIKYKMKNAVQYRWLRIPLPIIGIFTRAALQPAHNNG